MRAKVLLCVAALGLCLAPILCAQDAVKVDPKHYSVVSENDQVRILKVHYGAHEKSVMHSHPATVAVFLTDSTGQFNYPDGKKEAFTSKAGTAQYAPATTHLPENTGDKAFEVIVVELKGKGGAAKAAGTKTAPAKPAPATK
jgi:quercetin dioxygenase-like cupin family protein